MSEKFIAKVSMFKNIKNHFKSLTGKSNRVNEVQILTQILTPNFRPYKIRWAENNLSCDLVAAHLKSLNPYVLAWQNYKRFDKDSLLRKYEIKQNLLESINIIEKKLMKQSGSNNLIEKFDEAINMNLDLQMILKFNFIREMLVCMLDLLDKRQEEINKNENIKKLFEVLQKNYTEAFQISCGTILNSINVLTVGRLEDNKENILKIHEVIEQALYSYQPHDEADSLCYRLFIENNEEFKSILSALQQSSILQKNKKIDFAGIFFDDATKRMIDPCSKNENGFLPERRLKYI